MTMRSQLLTIKRYTLTSYIIGLVSNVRQKSKQLSEVMQVYIAMSEIGDLLYNTDQAM